jgi:hypothetical protein
VAYIAPDAKVLGVGYDLADRTVALKTQPHPLPFLHGSGKKQGSGHGPA